MGLSWSLDSAAFSIRPCHPEEPHLFMILLLKRQFQLHSKKKIFHLSLRENEKFKCGMQKPALFLGGFTEIHHRLSSLVLESS